MVSDCGRENEEMVRKGGVVCRRNWRGGFYSNAFIRKGGRVCLVEGK